MQDAVKDMIRAYFGKDNTKIVIVDLETMSTFESGIILSMGCCVADLTEELSFEQLLRDNTTEYLFTTQDQKHRHVQPSTVEWWSKQMQENPAAARVLTPNKDTVLPYQHAIALLKNDLRKHLGSDEKQWEKVFFFSRGPIDYYMLRHLHVFDNKEVEDTLPWRFWMLRDLRSWTHAMTGNKRGKLKQEVSLPGFIEHNAGHDCAADMIRLQQCFNMVFGEEE